MTPLYSTCRLIATQYLEGLSWPSPWPANMGRIAREMNIMLRHAQRGNTHLARAAARRTSDIQAESKPAWNEKETRDAQ